MATLQEIRDRLKQADKNSNENRGMDKAVYPFWDTKENAESVVRFLPDGDQNNTFFWAERQLIKLPFGGIKGEADAKPVVVPVPCNEMFGGTCPILTEVRVWFKDTSLEAMGRKYWKKRTYLFQGMVVSDGVGEEEPPENPIRRLILTPQVYQLVRAALVDPELEELPTDYVHGLDFRIKKTSKGGYADYTTSTWSRRERPLSEKEQAAIDQFGLFNLSDFLPKKPSDIELAVIKEMFEASVNGEAYDPSRWGQYYKPAGMSRSTSDNASTAHTPSRAPEPARTTETPTYIATHTDTHTSKFEEDLPFDPEPQVKPETTSANDTRAQDILKMIRSRQK